MERKPTPEQLLERVQTDEDQQGGGRLKIFLGYASGVGKSFRMLDEGRRRYERGQDVVVGALQAEISPQARRAIAGLEVIPLKKVDGVPVMDVDVILRRAPKVCLVDGLAYDNPPGSPRAKRWEDVKLLLDAGISVVTSVNLQHIEEKREQVEAITGKHVAQTVPLRFLQAADEIVVVDAPVETRLSFCDGSAAGAGQKLTRVQLSELREIALFLAADVVDKQLERYLAMHGIEQSWGTHERILVYLAPGDNNQRMLESAARNRDRFHGELVAAHMNRPEWSAEEKRHMDAAIALARDKGASVVALDGEDVTAALLSFARARGITQIFIGHRERAPWWERLFGSDLDGLIRGAEGIDVRIFPHV